MGHLELLLVVGPIQAAHGIGLGAKAGNPTIRYDQLGRDSECRVRHPLQATQCPHPPTPSKLKGYQKHTASSSCAPTISNHNLKQHAHWRRVATLHTHLSRASAKGSASPWALGSAMGTPSAPATLSLITIAAHPRRTTEVSPLPAGPPGAAARGLGGRVVIF